MSPASSTPARRALGTACAAIAVAATMLVLDLSWLGFVARDIYRTALGPLMRPTVHTPAAALFYAMYVAAILVHAVKGSHGPLSALLRGAGLGLVAYATYELTNWAVVRDWPAVLVPIDIGWGVVLTGVAGSIGKLAYDKVLARAK